MRAAFLALFIPTVAVVVDSFVPHAAGQLVRHWSGSSSINNGSQQQQQQQRQRWLLRAGVTEWTADETGSADELRDDDSAGSADAGIIATLKVLLAAHHNDIRNDIETRHVGIKTDFNELRADFAELREDFKDLRDHFNDLCRDFNDLRSDFAELRGDFNELRMNRNRALAERLNQDKWRIEYVELPDAGELNEGFIAEPHKSAAHSLVQWDGLVAATKVINGIQRGSAA
ncbi:hypothetical protein JKP88DRAFT_275442 [Tribonema minus]|uniref:Uncharacterized protein n=1 Tax=Tribonema minus TaxID=303371 RepID=A0A835ZCP3_9STRA|nr:hypothetical protein JKP88DRAFT_275442 [Tribonema minus]